MPIASQGCIKLVMTAPVGFGTPGKDAFHRVPLFVGEIGDAVERVLTSQKRELDAALIASPSAARTLQRRCAPPTGLLEEGRV